MIEALLIALALPLISFVVLVFFGSKLGEPKAGMLATAAIIGAAIIAMVVAVQWVTLPEALQVIQHKAWHWLTFGQKPIMVGVKLDSLTVVMFTMVTVVSSAIFLFSTGYMHSDIRFGRFFTHMSLFAFSMLGLVLADSLVLLFVFWELVGICSYFLIGFWFEKRSASDAAIKAFVVNRVGDFLFIIGIAVMLGTVGAVGLDELVEQVRAGAFDGQHGLLTFGGICLFFGAIGKSAQFPLHVWLPDAMEGPTPVSALIHAATMVAAGVYMVGRIFPIMTPSALLFVAYVGAITLFGSALIAIVMTDIKRVLAYSTISQLGYMILSLGLGGWIPALFHLITHACFKALLFLGSGSVIHACGDEQDVSKMGGLHGKLKITSWTFLIATAAIAGVPFFSGFYSKDAILANALGFVTINRQHMILFILPALAAAITAFYMMRVYILTFRGRPRDQHVYQHAHESPPAMWIPLVFLAALALAIGWGTKMPQAQASSAVGSFTYTGGSGLAGLIGKAQPQWAICWQEGASDHNAAGKSGTVYQMGLETVAAVDEHGQAPAAEQGGAEHHVDHHRTHLIIMIMATGCMMAGFGLAYLMYIVGFPDPQKLAQRFPRTYRAMVKKFYVDELYRATFVAAVLGLAKAGKWFDLTVLDGIVDGSARAVRDWAMFSGLIVDNRGVDGAVNGVATVAKSAGQLARGGQTGRVRNYLLITIGTSSVVLIVTLLLL